MTPFSDGEIAHNALKNLVQWQEQCGTAGIVICGVCGEGEMLTLEEREAVIATVMSARLGMPVILGVGAASTAECLEQIKAAEKAGVDALAVNLPCYTVRNEPCIMQFIKTLRGATRLPLIITGNHIPLKAHMSKETLLKICDLKNIYILERGDGDLEIPMCLEGGTGVLCGDDRLIGPYLVHGACGFVSVAANIVPRAMARLYQAWNCRRFDDYFAIYRHLYPLFRALSTDTVPVAVKYALEALGMCRFDVRPPLQPLPADRQKAIRNILNALAQEDLN